MPDDRPRAPYVKPKWADPEKLGEPELDKARALALREHHHGDPLAVPEPAYPIHPKHKKFADEWLTGAESGRPFHGPSAYEVAGYVVNESQPSANPSKLLRHPNVQKYITARMEEFSMSSMEVLMRFTEMARGGIGDVLTETPLGGIQIDKTKLMANRHLLRSFGYDNNGEMKVEFHDNSDALKQIARILGMNKDGLDVNHRGSAVIAQVQFVMPDGSVQSMGETSKQSEDVEVEEFSEYEEADFHIEDSQNE